ncbi:MAG: gamma-glutamyltranspeptidase/glutathione hydrolase [Gammaproteobacteria bacterium]|jgi:gamma-glutamyltranspeptidase/glutathione hydrolase
MNATPRAPRFTEFCCEKQPATGSQAMAVTNHPLASAAAAQMLLSGGNAIDAAVCALFALSVVEPMMVGVLGGGVAHIRLADGQHVVLDGLSTAPGAAHGTLYETVSNQRPNYRDTVGRANLIGARAVAVPGALAAWCKALSDFGTLTLDEVIAPAIRLAEHGFKATPYLALCVENTALDLARDAGLAALFLPGGRPLVAGTRVVQSDYAQTLRSIAKHGPSALYGGALGAALVAHLQQAGGIMTREDLAAFQVIDREPLCSSYRGYEILGPPPPASAGVHIAQMLNLLEGYDIAAMGFGSPDAVHLLAEVLKIAFADRAVATADPAFVEVPVAQLMSKAYAKQRRALIQLEHARQWPPGLSGGESKSTTHVTVADASGNVVASTQTINGVFGACVQIPGTGMLCNNYMYNFDPHPGLALSVEAGKRVFTSMAPMMVRRDGRLCFALGLPGALRIFPSAMQAIVNLLDHGMSLQEAVEAPRIWTDGGVVELEEAFPAALEQALTERGHEVVRVPRVAGGMNAIAFGDDGLLTGAACWRADGTPVAIAGGLARAGVSFSGL